MTNVADSTRPSGVVTSATQGTRRGSVKVASLPQLAAQWHPTRNGDLTADQVALRSHKKIWWRCPVREDHEWQVAPYARAARPRPESCPFCVGQRITPDRSLAAILPHIAAQWHPTRNGALRPDQVAPKSHRHVWWLCPDNPDHEWQTPISLRGSRETRCPYCTGRRATKDWNLAVAFPEIAALLHPESGSADLIAPRSGIPMTWKCPKGPDHEWRATPDTVVSGHLAGNTGCPACSGRQVSVTNSVASIPKLLAEYHPTKNPAPADQVIAGTNRKLWWTCGQGHEWQAQGTARLSRASNCPWCSSVPTSEFELELISELRILIPDVNRAGDRVFVAGRVRQVDLLIPSLNLAIEVDGAYWHRDKQDQDRKKSKMLAEAGWTALRLREEPLEPLGPLDCTFPQKIEAADLVLLLIDHLDQHGLLKPSEPRRTVPRMLTTSPVGGTSGDRPRR